MLISLFLLFSLVGIEFLRLLIKLFKLILLGVLLIDAIQFYSISFIFSMLPADLSQDIGLILFSPTFKEIIVNLDSYIDEYIQIFRVFIDY